METLTATQLERPELLRVAAALPAIGRLEESFGGLVYLNIDDAYIHDLFPLLQDIQAQKPDYFGVGSIGAHITIAYPEEGVIIHKHDRDQEYPFTVTGVFSSDLNFKKYYILHVESPSLVAFRHRYNLPDKPQFLGHQVDFHITIGVCPLYMAG